MRRFFEALGRMSISDAAFALQPFAGSAYCGDLAEKWLEKFNMYCAFKKLGDEDKLQLLHLLMKDRAADWLRALPEHKKKDKFLNTRVYFATPTLVRGKMEAESRIMEAKTITHRIGGRLCGNNASHGETTQYARAVSG
jgi:hypothetical protein